MSAVPFVFAYEIDDTVKVVPLELPGRVLQRCDRGAGQHDYQVVYWADGKRCVEWLLPHELAPPNRLDSARDHATLTQDG